MPSHQPDPDEEVTSSSPLLPKGTSFQLADESVSQEDPLSVSPCCQAGAPEEKPESPSEPADATCCSPKRSIDWLMWGSIVAILPFYALHWLSPESLSAFPWLATYAAGTFELLNKMWWGLLLGIIAVGVLARVPRDLVIGVIGKPGSKAGLLRATAAGILLDLCSHGILLIGMQLYRRGASLGQTMAFLIASPWNSFSLTLILIALIGWKWTLAFIGLSAVVGIITGMIFDALVRNGRLPANPHTVDLPDGFRLGPAFRNHLQKTDFRRINYLSLLRSGLSESTMILRWIFFGTVLAAVIRASLTHDQFGTWFGPTMAGLLLTLLATTVIEVCSEGSSPIAGDLLNRGGAPGNAFTFLMAGVATDYTEILSLRETTRSWLIALALPCITVPQVVVIGWILNRWASTG